MSEDHHDMTHSSAPCHIIAYSRDADSRFVEHYNDMETKALEHNHFPSLEECAKLAYRGL
jgi:hypothetical protein